MSYCWMLRSRSCDIEHKKQNKWAAKKSVQNDKSLQQDNTLD